MAGEIQAHDSPSVEVPVPLDSPCGSVRDQLPAWQQVAFAAGHELQAPSGEFQPVEPVDNPIVGSGTQDVVAEVDGVRLESHRYVDVGVAAVDDAIFGGGERGHMELD